MMVSLLIMRPNGPGIELPAAPLILPGPTGGRPANRPPNRAAGGWQPQQGPVWRPVSSNALLGSALPDTTLPLLSCAGNDPKQRMGSQALAHTPIHQAAVVQCVAGAQLSGEMLSFVRELTARRGEANSTPDRRQLLGVERVAALGRFGVYGCEIGVDCG